MNRFNNPDETGIGNNTDTYKQIIEDKEAIIEQMQEIRQTLFEYTTDNVEEFSQEISSIDDKRHSWNLKSPDFCSRLLQFS